MFPSTDNTTYSSKQCRQSAAVQGVLFVYETILNRLSYRCTESACECLGTECCYRLVMYSRLQRVRRTKVKFSRMLLFGIRQSRLYRLQLVRASSAVRNSVISDNEGTYAILPVCMCGDS